MIIFTLFITTCVAYILGSIPSGFIVARMHGIRDIREHGSGNIGATNVARVLGIKYFFLVFFCDFLKAFAYLALLSWYDLGQACLALSAVALLVGNGFPLFLNFRGGKGVATSFGILSILQPYLLFYAFICWSSIFALSKTVGIASVVTLMLIPLCSVFIVHDLSWMGLFAFFLSLWGLFLHRSNIKSFYSSSSK